MQKRMAAEKSGVTNDLLRAAGMVGLKELTNIVNYMEKSTIILEK